MRFIVKKGRELEISPEKINPCYVVDIIGETEKDYLVSDINKVEINFPKELVKTNGMIVGNNWIDLGETHYEYYFRPQIKKLEDEASKRLENSFEKILENKKLIFNNAEYYLIRCDFLSSGCFQAVYYCLGSLLEFWDYSDEFKYDTKFGTMYLISAKGSPFTGVHSATFWNVDRKEFFHKSVKDVYTPLKKALSPTVQEFARIGKNCKIKLRVNYLAIEKLINDISCLY